MTAIADFQHAKNHAKDPNFLQIVAKREPKIDRVAFKISRLMEFCSERELVNQTGHGAYEWPLVCPKELLDNALDAAEEAEVAPVISIEVDRGQDRHRGQCRRRRRRNHRVGARLHHPRIEPRGLCLANQGRAGQRAQDHPRHGLRASPPAGPCRRSGRGDDRRGAGRRAPDRVPRRPRLEPAQDRPHQLAFRGHGRNPLHYPLASAPLPSKPLREPRHSYDLVHAYVWFNPHLSIRGSWFGREFINEAATNPAWDKWRPRNPTSPTGTTRPGCNAISPPMWPGIATSDEAAPCGPSSPNFAACRHRRPAQGPR